MRPNTRNRRSLGTCLSPAQYDIHATDNEVAKDLQQLYQCSYAQVSQLLLTDAEPDPKASMRSKVRLTQRKRPYSTKESDTLDAVLGLASFISEGETPGADRKVKPTVIKNPELEVKPKIKVQPKPSPQPKPKPKSTPPPPVQRKVQQQSTVATGPAPYQMPYGYPFMFSNYMFPMSDKAQPSMALMPSYAIHGAMQPGVYPPPFSMMYTQGLFQKNGWPVVMPHAAVAQPVVAPTSFRHKRSARHVVIALLIRDEEKKRKGGEVGPTKHSRLVAS